MPLNNGDLAQRISIAKIQKILQNFQSSQIQWPVVSTPCQETKIHLNRSIKGNTKIAPVLEVTTCCLQGKYGVEMRIGLVNKDSSHRNYHGSNKFVMNLKNNEQETSEVQFEEHALRFNVGDFAIRSKAKAKPQRQDSASSSTRTKLIGGELD